MSSRLQLLVDKSDARPTLSHYVAVFLWMGWPGFYLSMLFVLPALLYLRSTALVAGILGAIAASALYTADIARQPKWGDRIGAWIVRKCTEYFRVRVYCEDITAVNSTGPALFVNEPHDVFPVGLFSFSDYLGYFHGHKIMGCVSSAIFAVPLMKHFVCWTSATNANRSNIESLINNGYTPTLCPGGVQEVLEMRADRKECVLYLKARKGIVKLALQFGIPIVPSFSFGQRQAFTFWIPQGTFFKALSRKIGFSPMVFFGLFGLPFSQPKPCPLAVVVGSPIQVPKIDMPTESQIAHYHGMMLSAIERLYETNKQLFNMDDVTLRII